MIQTSGSKTKKPQKIRPIRKGSIHYPSDAEDTALKAWTRVSGFDFTVGGCELFRYKEHLKVNRYENEDLKTANVFPIKGNISTLLTWNHFSHRHDMKLKRHAHTKQIIFVLREDEQKESYSCNYTASYLQQEMGDPEYIEYSESMREYHLYYIFNEWASRTDIEKWIVTARKEGFIFSVVMPNDKFYLPMSHRYNLCGTLEKIDFMKIHIKPFENGIEDLAQVFTKAFTETKRPLPSHIRAEYQTHGKKIKKTHIIGGENGKGFKRKIYSFGHGNRHEAFKMIALQSQRLGHTYHQFCNELDLMHDGTSRDMRRGCETQKRGAWEWALRVRDPNFIDRVLSGETVPDDYVVYQEYELSRKQIYILRQGLNKLAREYEQELEIPAEKLVDNTIKYYKELIQKREYDIDRERQYDEKLPEHMRNELNKGFIFTKTMRRQMAKKLGVQYIEQCHRFLILTKILNPIVVNNNGYYCTYSFKGAYKFAKHYTIMNPANIYLQTNHKFQIVFPDATTYEDIARDFKSEDVQMYWEYKKTLCNLFDGSRNTNIDVLEKIATSMNMYTYYSINNLYYIYSIKGDIANINYVATPSSLLHSILIGTHTKRPPRWYKAFKDQMEKQIVQLPLT